MSATNKTPFLDLPSFVGSDIPGWLTSWNDAMSKIDTGVQGINTIAGTANNNANSAMQQVGNIGDQVSQLQTDVTALQGTVGNLVIDPNRRYLTITPDAPAGATFSLLGAANSRVAWLTLNGNITTAAVWQPCQAFDHEHYYLTIATLNENLLSLKPGNIVTGTNIVGFPGISGIAITTNESGVTQLEHWELPWCAVWNGSTTHFYVLALPNLITNNRITKPLSLNGVSWAFWVGPPVNSIDVKAYRRILE